MADIDYSFEGGRPTLSTRGPQVGAGPAVPTPGTDDFARYAAAALADREEERRRREAMDRADRSEMLQAAAARRAPEPQAPSKSPIEQQLDEKRAQAEIQALNESMAPAPKTLSGGFNMPMHYEQDVANMSANQRRMFLPTSSTNNPAADEAATGAREARRTADYGAMDERNAAAGGPMAKDVLAGRAMGAQAAQGQSPYLNASTPQDVARGFARERDRELERDREPQREDPYDAELKRRRSQMLYGR